MKGRTRPEPARASFAPRLFLRVFTRFFLGLASCRCFSFPFRLVLGLAARPLFRLFARSGFRFAPRLVFRFLARVLLSFAGNARACSSARSLSLRSASALARSSASLRARSSVSRATRSACSLSLALSVYASPRARRPPWLCAPPCLPMRSAPPWLASASFARSALRSSSRLARKFIGFAPRSFFPLRGAPPLRAPCAPPLPSPGAPSSSPARLLLRVRACASRFLLLGARSSPSRRAFVRARPLCARAPPSFALRSASRALRSSSSSGAPVPRLRAAPFLGLLALALRLFLRLALGFFARLALFFEPGFQFGFDTRAFLGFFARARLGFDTRLRFCFFLRAWRVLPLPGAPCSSASRRAPGVPPRPPLRSRSASSFALRSASSRALRASSSLAFGSRFDALRSSASRCARASASMRSCSSALARSSASWRACSSASRLGFFLDLLALVLAPRRTRLQLLLVLRFLAFFARPCARPRYGPRYRFVARPASFGAPAPRLWRRASASAFRLRPRGGHSAAAASWPAPRLPPWRAQPTSAYGRPPGLSASRLLRLAWLWSDKVGIATVKSRSISSPGAGARGRRAAGARRAVAARRSAAA